jgi:serine/threonine protein kinase
MISRFKQQIWIVPLIIAGFVAVFGWWGNAQLRKTIEEQLAADLTATLDANVTALEIWTTNQEKLATALAEEPQMRNLAIRLVEGFEQVAPDGRKATELSQEDFSNYLKPRLRKLGYEVAMLVSTNLTVVADTIRSRWRPGLAVLDEFRAKFSELFASGQPVLITPFKPRPLAPGGPFRRDARHGPNFPRPGETSLVKQAQSAPPPFDRRPHPPPDGFRGNRDLTLMQVAAPVRDEEGAVRGALGLVINPDAEFTRILSVARSGNSGETYAFDQRGLMISRSRFDEQLKKLGLIEDRSGASSALSLRLSDPGSDSPHQITPEDPASATRPLTRIVADAVEGGSGVDVEPSRDYRGVEVVGAWRWLPQLGFGVATQIDADEAFRPLRVLKLLFTILVLLLMLSATGMFLFSYSNLIWRRRLSEVELKLRKLGQYTLEEKIGEGGMGVVYRARHALMRRETAVKLLLPDRADADAVQRFEREVCLSCRLTHPNTIQVYDYGHTPEGIFYYAMEFLRGVNLDDLVTQFGPQPEGRVIHILVQICGALAEAHALGLIHRDIKPANVFLCNRGGVPDCVKVLDFGLVREYNGAHRNVSRRSSEREAEGTPSYMSPESIQNPASSDPRSDIYSLGALGYFLLTARNVFEATTLRELYEKHLHESPVPPTKRTTNSISAELEATLLRCLAKEPGLRPASVEELRSLLLTSPRSDEWTLEARSAWWSEYETGHSVTSHKADRRRATSLEPTVKIHLGRKSP